MNFLPYQLHLGDSLEVLKGLEDNSIDAMVTDPPSGTAFMGKKWDTFRTKKTTETKCPLAKERNAFIDALVPIFEECFRVLKPGSFSLIWGLPRSAHWTAIALEEAGFEVAETIAHAFGSGFPKSMDIAKAIQKKNKVEPIGELPPSLGYANDPQWNALNRQLIMPEPQGEAAKWIGFGTALKPAREDWILVQKPFKGTYADNVLKWGVGGLNINACRIGANPGWEYPNGKGGSPCHEGGFKDIPCESTQGRFPANLILSHGELCQLVGTTKVKSGKAFRENSGGNNCHTEQAKPAMENMSYAGEDGLEEVELWACTPDCPVRIIDSQSGVKKSGVAIQRNRDGKVHNTVYAPRKTQKIPDVGYGDTGGASRFFYVAKPAKKEKEAGCENLTSKTAAELTGRKEGSEGLVMQHIDGSPKANPYAGTSGAEPRKNTHPTVKSTTLMSYLCRLVTPPEGTVLDPFTGSGSTGVAAIAEGFKFIGVEKEADYHTIAQARLEHAVKELQNGL